MSDRSNTLVVEQSCDGAISDELPLSNAEVLGPATRTGHFILVSI